MTSKQHACDSCGKRYDDDTLPKTLHQIHKLSMRLDPGCPVPSGECECGALTYLDDSPEEVAEGEGLLLTKREEFETFSRAWPFADYRGRSVYEAVYGSGGILGELPTPEGQECFLGYSPQNDSFLVGFDVDAEDDDDAPGLAIQFTIREGRLGEILSRVVLPRAHFYSDGYESYKFLHKEFPGLIDLRLD